MIIVIIIIIVVVVVDNFIVIFLSQMPNSLVNGIEALSSTWASPASNSIIIIVKRCVTHILKTFDNNNVITI